MTGTKSSRNQWYFLISAAVLSGCSLSEVHNGEYCPGNTNGYYADDAFSESQKDNAQSIEIQTSQYCQSTHQECIQDVCIRCKKDEVWVKTEDSDGFSCLYIGELDNCHTESCEDAKDRIAPICTSECEDGIYTRCLEYLSDAEKCPYGCNAEKTACSEYPCGKGETFNGYGCVCDTENHWVGDPGNCACDEENGYTHRYEECVLKQVCTPNREISNEDGTCLCNTEGHWEGVAGKCTCELGYTPNGDECVVKTSCDPDREITNEDGTCSCNPEGHWVGSENKCVCDEENNYIEAAGKCVEKSGCDPLKEVYNEKDNSCSCNSQEHWVGKSGNCACDEEHDYIEFNGSCVNKPRCDTAREKYNSKTNSCLCNDEKHWVGEAGKCACDSQNNYVQIDNSCLEKAKCDANKEVYSSSDNTCACDAAKHWKGEAGKCACESGFYIKNNQCIQKLDCSGFGEHVTWQSSDNSCACDVKNGWSGQLGNCTCSAPGFAVTTEGCKSYKSIQPGDKVLFAHYEQDNNLSNGKEEITWIVLAKGDDKAYADDTDKKDMLLLLSEKGLDNAPYAAKAETWGECYLHSWLHVNFKQDAFTDEEYDKVKEQPVKFLDEKGETTSLKDKLFILSKDEIESFFKTPEECILYPTPYAVAKLARTYDTNGKEKSDGSCKSDCKTIWYSRTSGAALGYVWYVNYEGTLVKNGLVTANTTVRPAMWVRF